MVRLSASPVLADRLALAEQIGVIAIDDSKVDPVQAVLDETMGLGADRGCECVGYQPHGPQGNEDTAATLNMLIKSVRFTGRIGTVGVFVPQGPGAKGKLAKQGKAAIDFGAHWFKGRVGRRRLGGDYDALLLPGGTVHPYQLRVDKDAVSFVRDFVEWQARGGDLSRAVDGDRGWRCRRSHRDVVPKHPHGSAQRRCGGR